MLVDLQNLPLPVLIYRLRVGCCHFQSGCTRHNAGFSKRDVRAIIASASDSAELDAAMLQALCSDRIKNGLFAKWELSEGMFDLIFFEIAGAKEYVRCQQTEGSQSLVILFDPTHGTNRYGFPASAICAVNPNGTTTVLALVIFRRESISAFRRACKYFVDTFGSPPNVIFTDGDDKLAAAIEAEWGRDTIHLWCVWHLWQNFWAKVYFIILSIPHGHSLIYSPHILVAGYK